MAPVTVKWANACSVGPCEIEKGMPRRMDLVHAVDFQPDQLLLFTDPKQHTGVETRFPLGKYRARVQISAENAKAVEGYFEITFKKWDDIYVEKIKKFDIPDEVLPPELSALSANISNVQAGEFTQSQKRIGLLNQVRLGQEVLTDHSLDHREIAGLYANAWTQNTAKFLKKVSDEALEGFLTCTDVGGLVGLETRVGFLQELVGRYEPIQQLSLQEIRNNLLDKAREGRLILNNAYYQNTILIGDEIAENWAEATAKLLRGWVDGESVGRFLKATSKSGMEALPERIELLGVLTDGISPLGADALQGPSV